MLFLWIVNAAFLAVGQDFCREADRSLASEMPPSDQTADSAEERPALPAGTNDIIF